MRLACIPAEKTLDAKTQKPTDLRRSLLLQTLKPSQMKFDLQNHRLYGILDMGYVAPPETTRVATERLVSGVEILQLRAKDYEPEQILELAQPLVSICRSFGVP